MKITESAPRPRILTRPPLPDSYINDAAIVAAVANHAGRPLDPWQVLVHENAMLMHGGSWVTPRVGLLTPRQNGKTVTAEARELTGLFVYSENIIHAAPTRDMARVAFDRMLELIQSASDLDRQVRKVNRAYGQWEIQTVIGNRIRYWGQPLTADLLVIDDAHTITEDRELALLSSAAGSINPQIWYLGCAVRKNKTRRNGLADPNKTMRVFTRLRKQGIAGTEPGLCWVEYSAPDDRDKDGRLLVDTADPAVWRFANPSARLDLTHIQHARELLQPEWFEAEFLGIGDWPELDEAS